MGNPRIQQKKFFRKKGFGACGSSFSACLLLYMWILAPQGFIPGVVSNPRLDLRPVHRFKTVIRIRTQCTDLRQSVQLSQQHSSTSIGFRRLRLYSLLDILTLVVGLNVQLLRLVLQITIFILINCYVTLLYFTTKPSFQRPMMSRPEPRSFGSLYANNRSVLGEQFLLTSSIQFH